MASELYLEVLLGKPVLDLNGKTWRIHEMQAEQQGNDWVILEYFIGPIAVLERLSAWTIGRAVLPLLKGGKAKGGYRVPWDKLDLSDPEKPRLRCAVDELQPLE